MKPKVALPWIEKQTRTVNDTKWITRFNMDKFWLATISCNSNVVKLYLSSKVVDTCFYDLGQDAASIEEAKDIADRKLIEFGWKLLSDKFIILK